MDWQIDAWLRCPIILGGGVAITFAFRVVFLLSPELWVVGGRIALHTLYWPPGWVTYEQE